MVSRRSVEHSIARSPFSVTSSGALKTIFSFTIPLELCPSGQSWKRPMATSTARLRPVAALSSGVVYKVTSAGVYTVLHNFDTNTRANGITPNTGLVQGSDGFLYGVTSGGGTAFGGTIFKIKTDGTSFAVIHSFDITHGSTPNSQPLLHTNGKIYGLTNSGGAHNDGVLYSLDAGLGTFVVPVGFNAAKVGQTVGILGQNLTTATQVMFGTGPGTFTISGNGFINAKPALGAKNGIITVKEPGGNQLSPAKFKIVPNITSFTPTSGPVGTPVVITGTSFNGATSVKFSGKAATFTVNSNTQVTATVPTGAVTGKISITTPGGTGTSTTTFTVE